MKENDRVNTVNDAVTLACTLEARLRLFSVQQQLGGFI